MGTTSVGQGLIRSSPVYTKRFNRLRTVCQEYPRIFSWIETCYKPWPIFVITWYFTFSDPLLSIGIKFLQKPSQSFYFDSLRINACKKKKIKIINVARKRLFSQPNQSQPKPKNQTQIQFNPMLLIGIYFLGGGVPLSKFKLRQGFQSFFLIMQKKK